MKATIISYESTPSGDAVKISTTVEYAPMVFVALSSFTGDSIAGVTENFKKQYSIGSADGTVFEDWKDFDNQNIKSFEDGGIIDFHIRWRYLLIGADPISPNVGEEFIINTLENVGGASSFKRSTFSDQFNPGDIRCINWSVNVLEKIFDEGIVPKYMTRGLESITEDVDYINYWKPIVLFFSYLVVLSRSIENYYDNEEMLREFLRQYSVENCGGENLATLQIIASNFFKNFRERGTSESFKASSERGDMVNGEFLRMICFDESNDDFFKIAVNRAFDTGWSLNNSSPMYKGSRLVDGLNLGYEDSVGIKDILKYPINASNSTVTTTILDSNTFDGEQDVFNITPGPTGSGGIGASSYVQANDIGITIDPRLSYEITAKIKQNSNAREGITFGCDAIVRGSSSLSNNALGDITNSDNPSNLFLEQVGLPSSDQYYLFSGIIFAFGTTISNAVYALEGLGQNHLRFIRDDVTKIIPFFYTDPALLNDYTLSVYDIKIKPVSLNYSKCFLDNKNFIDIIAINKNNSLTDDEVDRKLRSKIIPYNTSFKTTYL